MFSIFSKSKKSPPKKKLKKKVTGSKKLKTAVEAKPEIDVQPIVNLVDDTPPSSITSAQDKLNEAKANLEAGNFKQKLAPNDRQALIQQALAVHKVQSKLLDDLGEETKQRLRSLAMEKVFKITQKN